MSLPAAMLDALRQAAADAQNRGDTKLAGELMDTIRKYAHASGHNGH